MRKYKIVPKSEITYSGVGDHINRKWIEWDDDKVSFVHSLYLNGYSDQDVADHFKTTVPTLLFRLKQQPDLKQIFLEAKKIAIANSTKALQKIAEGYFEDEVTYGFEFKRRKDLLELFDGMLQYCPKTMQKGYQDKYLGLLEESDIIKTTKKWYPPNKDAINKILDAHKGDVWDLEARKKAIPQVKLNITMDNKLLRQRQIKPDYEVVS